MFVGFIMVNGVFLYLLGSDYVFRFFVILDVREMVFIEVLLVVCLGGLIRFKGEGGFCI